METEEKEAEKEEEKKEPKFCILENPTRVLPSQLKLLSIAENSKYKPVKSIQSGGIILVENTKPDEEEVLVERVAAGGPKTEENAKEETDIAPMPKAFKWLDEYDKEDEKMEDDKKDEAKKE